MHTPRHTARIASSLLAGVMLAASSASVAQAAVPLHGASRVSAGGAHTCGLMTSGGILCWGGNSAGQLGDGTQMPRATPVGVVGLSSGISAISAGRDHTCALTVAGGVKCWGLDYDGQLGDGSGAFGVVRLTPVGVVGLAQGVAAIAAGASHSCAVTSAVGVKCWGRNDHGQLGDGTTMKRLVPVDVSGLASGVAAVALGEYHTCAVMTAGGAKCWGDNDDGQLGDGSMTERHAPANVVGLVGATAITAGDFHACALAMRPRPLPTPVR
jgi:alpha-tubulin suppressor-like RCC1 family protein